MSSQALGYDVKKIPLLAGETVSKPFALNPVHRAGLLYVSAATGDLTPQVSTKDFRIRHLSESTGSGETSVAQLQVPQGTSLTGIQAQPPAGPIVISPVVDGWVEIPEAVMKAPRIKVNFTALATDVDLWIITKA